MKLKKSVVTCILSLSLLLSCNDDIPKLRGENKSLKEKVDSLHSVLDSIVLRPYLSNLNNQININEYYKNSILAVVQNGVRLNRFYINDKQIDLDTANFSNNFFGPELRYKFDSIGVFECKAYILIQSWGDHEMAFSWDVTVTDE